ncbi:MAG: class I adenylate-forming enzyme family protein, partial [Chloroflexota bacterium]
MTIVEMLARNARMYPHDVALVLVVPSQNLRQPVTWQEFDQGASRVANFLLSRGIRKGDTVLQLMNNSIDWLVAYFGILRTGAWVTPLNFRFNSSDLQFCAGIAEPKAFILGDEFVERVKEASPELKTIRDYIFFGQNPAPGMVDLRKEMEEQSPQAPDVELRDEEPCGLYFTSGTTGTPKPILLMHRNLECAAINSAVHRRDTHQDSMLAMGPLYHASTIMHWMGNLIVGGRGILLVDKKVLPQHIIETIHKERVTEIALYTPWLLDLLLALDRGEVKKENYDLSCLRIMHMGAQPIPISLVERWQKYFPNVIFNENYGLTETAGPGCVCTVGTIGMKKKPGAIGKPGFNWEARIVNEQDEDVPLGEIGEVVVRGNGVMKEFYKNPEETAKILKNGWLHTGDLGRKDEEGYIFLVDRKKDVIISGGENIYPQDVEPVLVSHEKVFDAALIGIPDDRMGEIAVAIIEPKPGVTLTEEEM